VVWGALLSDTTQNIVDSLQVRLHDLEVRLNALQAAAKRHAFEACVEDSWRARQNFKDAVETADKLSDEATMVTMALQEAYLRLQTQWRPVADVMRELKFGATTNEQ
jgi:hypothetical protein